MCVCKILLRVMLILKVHGLYEYWEVRPAQGKVKDVKFRAESSREKQSWAQNGSITLLTINLENTRDSLPIYRL